MQWVSKPEWSVICSPALRLLQERLVLSVLPRFVVLEMINDMTNVEDEHLQHQFHRIYIHRYENVRWGAGTTPPQRKKSLTNIWSADWHGCDSDISIFYSAFFSQMSKASPTSPRRCRHRSWCECWTSSLHASTASHTWVKLWPERPSPNSNQTASVHPNIIHSLCKGKINEGCFSFTDFLLLNLCFNFFSHFEFFLIHFCWVRSENKLLGAFQQRQICSNDLTIIDLVMTGNIQRFCTVIEFCRKAAFN